MQIGIRHTDASTDADASYGYAYGHRIAKSFRRVCDEFEFRRRVRDDFVTTFIKCLD